MAERGFYDPKQEFPQTNAQDLIGYWEFYDLEYAIPKSRDEGVTLSLASNGGEVEWFARDLLKVSTIVGERGVEALNGWLFLNIALVKPEFGPAKNNLVVKGTDCCLLLGVNAMANRTALHENNWVVAILPRHSCG